MKFSAHTLGPFTTVDPARARARVRDLGLGWGEGLGPMLGD